MVISDKKNVVFVSYSGKDPNLCDGTLVLLINGKEYKFSSMLTKPENGVYPSFWMSGGGCGYKAPWSIYASNLPEEIRQYAYEIDEVFNDNVPFGCCGGCS